MAALLLLGACNPGTSANTPRIEATLTTASATPLTPATATTTPTTTPVPCTILPVEYCMQGQLISLGSAGQKPFVEMAFNLPTTTPIFAPFAGWMRYVFDDQGSIASVSVSTDGWCAGVQNDLTGTTIDVAGPLNADVAARAAVSSGNQKEGYFTKVSAGEEIARVGGAKPRIAAENFNILIAATRVTNGTLLSDARTVGLTKLFPTSAAAVPRSVEYAAPAQLIQQSTFCNDGRRPPFPSP